MRRITVPLAGLATMAVALAATPSAPAGTAPADRGQDPEAGKAIFEGKGNCFTCHGRDATGTPLAPDLTDAAWVNFEARPSPGEVETLVKEGVARPVRYPAPMPPMGGARLSDQEVADVAAYVLSLSEATESARP